MSSRAFGWAWGLSLPPAQKMVLLALADVASPDKDQFACPISYIEKVACMDAAEIDDAIAALVAKDLVSHSHGLYRLGLPPLPPRESRPVAAGCVYIMVSGGKTKVGVSTDLNQRLYNIKATLPDVRLIHSFPMLITEARKYEGRCLAHFAHDALHGEWLSTPPDDVIEYLQRVTGKAGTPA
ncbi:GIY-YIG nuclease family protein [Devosia sp. SL43]|uniref:GIY-YIG nuclease family protein n=1 Tax=Devosia sp. SL43 TaxID=2806348 RepID=UPI001F410768|nr:GIY-YIG nuclease family protein [Devosia sp. SL43]UJW87908.1 GIY-YIG nuclease family protein [Devosia sp. SL43]